MTAGLNVRFRKPVPLEVALTVVGWITMESSRLFEGTGELYLPDGAVAVEAAGKYVKREMPEQDVKMAFLAAGDSEIELLEPIHAESGIGKYLTKRGEGLYHIHPSERRARGAGGLVERD